MHPEVLEHKLAQSNYAAGVYYQEFLKGQVTLDQAIKVIDQQNIALTTADNALKDVANKIKKQNTALTFWFCISVFFIASSILGWSLFLLHV